jgi:pyruvate dehydrogenase E2 component (dihydrolipoamide acetyltransferase)
MIHIVMPRLGLTQESGTIIEWCKCVGDHISQGDIVLIIETDKVVSEVLAEYNGIIEEILVEPGAEVPVFTPLAVLRED